MLNLTMNDREIADRIKDLADKGETKNLPWGDIGHIVEASIHKSIDLGGRWEDKDSPYTGSRRWKRPDAGNQPLYRTGAFDRSIRSEIDSDGVMVGSPLEYPLYLQYGTRSMEERPWANLSQEEDIPDIEDILKKHFGL